MEHLSHMKLDGLRLGQLADDEAATARAHLGDCETCRARVEGLDASRAAFDARFEPAALAAETLAALDTARRQEPWWARFGVARLATTAVALLVVGALALTLRPSDGGDIRLKGAGAALELFVMDAGEPRAAGDEGVPAASTLRLRYDAGDQAFTRILWVDGDGRVDALMPGPTESALRGAGEATGPRWMPHEIDLDDDTRPEALAAVFCDRDIDHVEARSAVTAGSAPEGCRMERLTVRKR